MTRPNSRRGNNGRAIMCTSSPAFCTGSTILQTSQRSVHDSQASCRFSWIRWPLEKRDRRAELHALHMLRQSKSSGENGRKIDKATSARDGGFHPHPAYTILLSYHWTVVRLNQLRYRELCPALGSLSGTRGSGLLGTGCSQGLAQGTSYRSVP